MTTETTTTALADFSAARTPLSRPLDLRNQAPAVSPTDSTATPSVGTAAAPAPCTMRAPSSTFIYFQF